MDRYTTFKGDQEGVMRQSFEAYIEHLVADLLCDFRDGKITPARAIAELRLARKELLRALDAVESSSAASR